MNFFTAFDISASGMAVERMRLDVTAQNLANANTTRAPDGRLYQPLRVVAMPFDRVMRAHMPSVQGVRAAVAATADAPRMVYEPGHPDANGDGYVAYPRINPVAEMVNLISATRAYEANVVAMNAAKAMALKTLDIGGGA